MFDGTRFGLSAILHGIWRGTLHLRRGTGDGQVHCHAVDATPCESNHRGPPRLGGDATPSRRSAGARPLHAVAARRQSSPRPSINRNPGPARRASPARPRSARRRHRARRKTNASTAQKRRNKGPAICIKRGTVYQCPCTSARIYRAAPYATPTHSIPTTINTAQTTYASHNANQ